MGDAAVKGRTRGCGDPTPTPTPTASEGPGPHLASGSRPPDCEKESLLFEDVQLAALCEDEPGSLQGWSSIRAC